MFVVKSIPRRFDTSVAARFTEVETASLGHIMDYGFLEPAIASISGNARVCGAAFTVSLPGDDGTALSHALTLVQKGDVLVIERVGDTRHACWGAVTTAAACAAGIAGVVLDGFVTDLSAIRASNLPLWARGTSPITTKLRGQGGRIGTVIACGNVAVTPGALVLADENGVCILPDEGLDALLEAALALQEREPSIIQQIREGVKLGDINGASALIGQSMIQLR
jgi:4-hydroxy-4-methyl-2-oxoglutarate aldolase